MTRAETLALRLERKKIAEALQPTASQQLWMIDAYSLVLAGLLVASRRRAQKLGAAVLN